VAWAPDILAMDVATTTAVCRGKPGDIPTFKTKTFRGEDHLQICGSAIGWIARELTDHPPDMAYIEKPMALGAAIHGKSNAKSIVRLNALYGIVGGACLLKGVPVVGVDVQKARVAFIGEGALERDEAKRRCRNMCRALGWPASNLDEADAACVWYWACCCEAPKIAAVIHPGMHVKVASLTMAEELGRELGVLR
jgi:Holliday junction resolvasome RuvABC endonuclease subunit